MAICVALSFLTHLVIMALATLVPFTSRPAESVMVVDLADLPRVSDFLPPKPGILEGGRPRVPSPKPESRPRAEARPQMPPRVMEGRVPDLPVNPALPPEEKFPLPRAGETPAGAAREAAAKPPRAVGKTEPAEKTARAVPVEPGASGSAGKPLKELTPSLGKIVIAMGERGGRGSGNTSGETVGTGGKAGERGAIVEEGGATLKALNAPEIQYISYFAGIKRKIELVWGYPAAAAGIEGDVIVDFVIARSGKLDAIRLVNGSGHSILDDEALGAIRKASPYDPIPSEYKIPNLQIRAHFVYTVTQTRIIR
ncbi:MAG: TonB family protein [Deltaproteobacteria bacterium]|nr:TonB family protein [Deltaproteobacteria bacterium]